MFVSYSVTPTARDICCSILNFDLVAFLSVLCFKTLVFEEVSYKEDFKVEWSHLTKQIGHF